LKFQVPIDVMKKEPPTANLVVTTTMR
jgi:hypothetical protein